MAKHAPAMDKYAPLPGWARAPAYCLACSTLSIEAAGLDAEGDPVCPRCESADVYLAEPAEGVRVVEEDDEPDEDTSSDTLHDRYDPSPDADNRDTLLDAIEYAAQLEDQVEILVDPDVEKLVYEDGVLEAWLGDAPALKLLTASLGKTLDEHEAGNYLQVELKAEEQPEPYKVVVHRPGAKTPHEKREEAEAERDVARAERDRLLRFLEDLEEWLDGKGGSNPIRPYETDQLTQSTREVLREVEQGDTDRPSIEEEIVAHEAHLEGYRDGRREAFEEAAGAVHEEFPVRPPTTPEWHGEARSRA